MSRVLRFDDEISRRVLPAGLVSIVAHLGLFWAIGTGATLLPPDESLSPLRFVGQTFDVDALGADNQDEARPPGSESAPSAAAPLEEPPPDNVTPAPEADTTYAADENNATVDAHVEPPAKSKHEHEPIVEKPDPSPHPVKPPDNDPKEQENEEARAKRRPARPSQNPIDPFDLAVPGDSSGSAVPQTPSDTGSYGAEGSQAPVTDVFKAFLHLFPEANRHNPAWHDLPLGPFGRVEFSLTVGENARLLSIEIHDNEKAPSPKLLTDAVRKTQTYLFHQRLGWEGARRDGSERLALTIRVEQKSPHATTPEREGTQRHGRYGEARPTGAFFTYYDGRHIDIELERVP